MSTSQRVTLRRLREVFRLINEVKELGSDHRVWRLHALRGLIGLIDGQVGISLDLRNLKPGIVPQFIEPLDIGWAGEREQGYFKAYANSGASLDDPGTHALLALQKRTRFATASREQLIPDKVWYSAPAVQDYRRLGKVDGFLTSVATVGPGVLHGFILYRPWGGRPFQLRERKLSRIFHAELLRALKDHSPDPASQLNALPPRLQQVARLILEGLSAKESAARLELSVQTVQSYSKAIYNRLNLHTRGEFMAHFLARPRRPLVLPSGFGDF
ncbi:MAG TPA: LuxR C-terminal-related transcriptional regulator [Tepidisphaeraceae bacterium]|nr:LuxR C-terminal-related transcriptional regulator [Tepidisphaeraceae bacterium]